MQGTNGHADQLGDLLSALSSLNEIPDLLESIRSKLSSTTVGIRHRHGCTPFGSRVVVVVWPSAKVPSRPCLKSFTGVDASGGHQHEHRCKACACENSGKCWALRRGRAVDIVLEGLRGEDSIAGKKQLAGDTAREATSDEVKELKAEARQLKETLAEVLIENRLLKKSVLGDGEDAS